MFPPCIADGDSSGIAHQCYATPLPYERSEVSLSAELLEHPHPHVEGRVGLGDRAVADVVELVDLDQSRAQSQLVVSVAISAELASPRVDHREQHRDDVAVDVDPRLETLGRTVRDVDCPEEKSPGQRDTHDPILVSDVALLVLDDGFHLRGRQTTGQFIGHVDATVGRGECVVTAPTDVIDNQDPMLGDHVGHFRRHLLVEPLVEQFEQGWHGVVLLGHTRIHGVHYVVPYTGIEPVQLPTRVGLTTHIRKARQQPPDSTPHARRPRSTTHWDLRDRARRRCTLPCPYRCRCRRTGCSPGSGCC